MDADLDAGGLAHIPCRLSSAATTASGKNARIYVQRVGEPGVTDIRTWGAYPQLTVKRASDLGGASDDALRRLP